MRIESYRAEQRADVLALSLRAWAPVFDALQPAVPGFVYESFYPAGWQQRQYDDLAALLDTEPATVSVAVHDAVVVGWIAVRLHPGDRMGEIHVLAVDPAHQRRGVATLLMRHAFEQIRAAGMRMAMVETGGDPGHAAARASYEAIGFQRWPVARYFKDLDAPANTAPDAGQARPLGAFAEIIYEDLAAALDWLTVAFGLTVGRVADGPDGTPVFAELHAGAGTVLARPPQHDGEGAPRTLGGGTQQLYVPVDAPDAHCVRARAHGAEIVLEPADTFGARMYSARDLEGHLWTFGTFQVRG